MSSDRSDYSKSQTPYISQGKFIAQELHKTTVLVIEDNVADFILLARLLGFLGIFCEWKTSLDEVVDYAGSMPRLDFILLDLEMSKEDGFRVLKQIRSSPFLKTTRIVALSNNVNAEQAERARAVSFDGFLGKPLDFDHSVDLIRKILRGENIYECA